MPPLKVGTPLSSTPPLGFPGCPADNCTIPVGLVIGGITVSGATLVGAGWHATLHIANGTAVVVLGPLELTALVSATSGVSLVRLRNIGATAALDLNVTTWGNDNVLRVEVAADCASGAQPAPMPCPPAGGPLTGQYVHKSASANGSPFPIDGVIMTRPLTSDAALPAASSATFSYTVPYKDWSSNKMVDTTTYGVTSLFSLPPGRNLTLGVAVAASRDPDVYPAPPGVAAAASLAALSPASLPALIDAHVAWWSAFWSRSAIGM